LFLKYGEALFGDTPVVLVTSEAAMVSQNRRKPNMTSLMWGWDTENTVAIIRDLLPQTKHLFVVSGTSKMDLTVRKTANKALRKSNGRFNVQYLIDFDASELLENVAHLPRDSAILYLTVLRDATGKAFVPRDFMALISEKANAPVFGLGDTLLGHGVVGGSLVSAGNHGEKLAEIAVRLLSGESPKEGEWKGKNSLPMFDWRQLKRWSIDEKRLPPGSIVRYREPSTWEDHKGKIIGAIVIIFSQAFALILLLIQRKKRSQAEDESQRLRDDLTHVSRVLSMGEIATSLAHEINQPLTAIQSYAQAAKRFLAGDPPDIDEVGKSLDGVVAGNRRAKEVIGRIRMTLEKEPLERIPLQVKDLIHDVIMLVQRSADEKKVLLRLDLAAGLPQVFGDRTQLQQVLLNLIINGFEAIGDAGDGSRELVVRASEDEPDSVKISVQDSGIGIDEEHRDLLFNAFFTTKAEGLGMGLSISRSIIEDHGGRLWATQNPEQGTTFSFTVPIYMEDQR
jgi:signal transduction histidine kinase